MPHGACRKKHHQSTVRPVVDIVIDPGRVAIIRPVLNGLIEMLTVRRHRFVASGGPTGYRREEWAEAHVRTGPGDRMVIDVGLLPRVLIVLDEFGCPYRVHDRREQSPRFRLQPGMLDDLDRSERELVEALRREHQGLIEVAGPRAAIEDCVTICRAYRDARIVLAVATSKQAWQLWRVLVRQLCERVTLATSGSWIDDTRLLVGTYSSVPYWMVGSWDALILPCGEEATGERAVAMIRGMRFPRVYALVSTGHPVDRGIGLMLEHIAGPVIRPLGRPRVPVRVVMVPTPSCISVVTSDSTALTRKRALYWDNATRNARIAAVARAIAAGDWGELEGFGIAGRDVRGTRVDRDPRVVVMVESTEHARQVSELLPGWPVRAASPRADTGTKTPRTNSASPRIVTSLYAHTHGIRADVLIRATGTEWPLRVRGFPAVRRDDVRSALLIDFEDRGVRDAARDTERRVTDYVRRGMDVLRAKDVDATGETIERNSSDDAGPSGPSEVGPASPSTQRSGRMRPIPSRSSGGRE